MKSIRELLFVEIIDIKSILETLQKLRDIVKKNDNEFFEKPLDWDEIFNYFVRKVERGEISKFRCEFGKIFVKGEHKNLGSGFFGKSCNVKSIMINPLEKAGKELDLIQAENLFDNEVYFGKERMYLRFLIRKICNRLDDFSQRSQDNLKFVKK